MGSGASTLEGIDKAKLEALQAELKKPADLSDLAEGSAKDEVKKIRDLFNASGLDKVGSDEVKKEAGKPVDCSDIDDDGKTELTRLRSLLGQFDAKEGSLKILLQKTRQKIRQKILTQPRQMRL